MSNTTTRGPFVQGTNFSSGSLVAVEGLGIRIGNQSQVDSHRDSVVLQGQYVVQTGGQAEIVISVDPKAFNQKIAVRRLNESAEGDSFSPVVTSFGLDTIR